MNQKKNNLIKYCQEAVITFNKLNREEYSDILSKLNWCLGSYQYGNNPEGLIEYGAKSLSMLKSIKAKHPRKVNKKIIKGLEKAILSV